MAYLLIARLYGEARINLLSTYYAASGVPLLLLHGRTSYFGVCGLHSTLLGGIGYYPYVYGKSAC